MSSDRPSFDPWLPSSRLRRDRRGLSVPYINLWGEQTPANTRVALDPHLGMRAEFVDENPDDSPNFLKQCAQRQRECAWLGLCQVCGRPIPWSRRFLPLAPSMVENVVVEGQRYVAFSEPWLDARCAHIALNWCPALIRHRRDEALRLVPITSPGQVRMTVSKGWLEGPFEAETKADLVAMRVKIIVLGLDITIADGKTDT